MRNKTLMQELGELLYERRVVKRYEDESALSFANHDCRIDVVKATKEEWEVISKYFDYVDGYGAEYLLDIGELDGDEPVVVWYHYDGEICFVGKVSNLKERYIKMVDCLINDIKEK